MCIDRHKLTDAVFGGLGVFEGYVPRACWGHIPPDKLGEGKKYFYPDAEAAKKLVKEAGYELPVNITLEYTNAYTASYRAGGEALIGMLDQSGVFKVKPVIKEYGAYIKSTFVGKYSGDCGYILTTPPIEADEFLWDLYHSKGRKNAARVNDPWMDKMIEAQRVEIDEEKRLKLLHEIQYYMADQVFTAPLPAFGRNFCSWGDVVNNFKPHLSPPYNWGDIFKVVWSTK